MFSIRYILIFALFFQGFVQAFAQSDSLKVKTKTLGLSDVIEGKMPEGITVVSASRSGKTLEDLPITAFVITKEEIRKNGYTSLTEVLKSAPGIRVSRPGSGFLGEMFLMRGQIGNEYTKILINSVPIQPSSIGGLPLGEQLPIAQAEAIEIIYGPAASVYGADAMAGVINIITQQPESGSLVQANAIGGAHGYKNINMMVGGKLGKNKNVVSYNVFANYAERTTWDVAQHGGDVFNMLRDAAFYLGFTQADYEFIAQNPQEALQAIIGSTSNDGFIPFYQGGLFEPVINNLPHQSYLIGGSFKLRNFQGDFLQMYREDHANLGITPYLFSYSDPNSMLGESIQRFRLGYTKDWKKISLTTNLSYLRHRANPNSYVATNYSAENFGRNYYYNASDDIFGEMLLTYRPSSTWELIAGISHTESSSFPNNNTIIQPFDPDDYQPFTNNFPPSQPILGDFGFYPQTFRVTGSFLQVFFEKKRWTVTGGMRLEVPSHYETESNFSTRIALQYKITDRLSVRLTSGGAFKAPSPNTAFNALAVPVPKEDLGSVTDSISYELIPNENLRPETLSASELGFRYRVSSKVYLELASYNVFIDNLITTTFIPIPEDQYPLALRQFSVNSTVPSGFVRAPVNDDASQGVLVGIQFIMRLRNLLGERKLNSDVYLNFADGQEELPQDRGTIQGYRLVPRLLAKWNFDFEPFPNAYLRVENTYSGSWYRRFIPAEGAQNAPNARTDGFYNLDVTARYQLSNSLDAFVKVFNVFDAKYGGIDARGADVDLDYNPQIGRNFQIGITYHRK